MFAGRVGCNDCNQKGGCDDRKGTEQELLDEILPLLYPDRVWGRPDDAVRFGAGVDESEARRLARLAAEALQARAYFRPGDPSENCNYIYVLCVGREPGVYELRDAEVLDVPDGDHIREKYLRAALSTMARVAVVQEVSFELDREDDVYVIRKLPRGGVYDPILLKRTQKLIDLLVGANVTYLDFGLVERAPEGFDPADYAARYGQEPGIVNYLFYPQPATATSIEVIPCRTAAHLS